MSDQGDEEPEQDSDTGDADLAGRLRSPSGLSTDSDPEDEDKRAVDRLSARLRGGDSTDEEAPPAPGGPSSTVSETSDDDAPENGTEDDFEDVLLDALGSEAEETSQGTPPRAERLDGGDREAEPDIESSPLGTHETNQQGGRQPQTSPSPRESESPGTEQHECPSCQTSNPPETRFCVQCGQQLDAHRSSTVSERDEGQAVLPNDIELVCIQDDGSDGKSISIHSETTIIGRDGDQRFPTDEFLNPRHARLVIEDGDLHVEDLHSLNGTFIKIRGEVRLKPGDTFLMGRQVLRFEKLEEDFEAEKTSPDGTRYMGSPPPEGEYKVLQLGAGDLVQDIYCLPESGVVLGREKGDIIFPRDKFMSGRHARIVTDDDCHLVDLNSSNGTWIKLWKKTKLENDDYLFMGQQLFRVERN